MFPTRVILMAEYGRLLPLWDRSPSPDQWFGPFERGVLGLPVQLETRLVRWNERFETLMGPSQEWPSPEEHLAFVVDGHLLAADVQREFGSNVFVLYLDADGERSRVPRDERSGGGSWVAVGQNGSRFSPEHLEPRSIAEQMREMPDVEFEAMTRNVEIWRFVWAPGRRPTRILLEPQKLGLPLLDRSPLIDMASDRLDGATLGLSEPLIARLHDWNDRWFSFSRRQSMDGKDEAGVEYLIEGHEVAAGVQQEVGPDVAILFPEADAERSKPSAEMQQFVDRMRARDDKNDSHEGDEFLGSE